MLATPGAWLGLGMLHRRFLLAAPVVALAPEAWAQRPVAKAESTFLPYIDGVKAEALKAGIRAGTLEAAFRGIKVPNARVIELDRKQPEFTLTWEQYRAKVISDARIARGREHFARHRALITEVCAKYRLSPAPLMVHIHST